MRRVGLLALVLLMLSLTTAFAASFDVQAEDITSFTTDVSISVPVTPFPSTLYVRGPATSLPGTIDLEPPAKNDSVTAKLIGLGSAGVQEQTDTAKYFSWHSPTAPSGGYMLQGTVTLYIEQNNGGTNLMTAGLFNCDAEVGPDSADTDLCVPISIEVGTAGDAGNGYQERTVVFGSIPSTLIPEGNQLRLKIVNKQDVSATDWDLQWGFLPSRQSRLVIA